MYPQTSLILWKIMAILLYFQFFLVIKDAIKSFTIIMKDLVSEKALIEI